MKKFDYDVKFNRKDYKSFEDFYRDITKKLETEKDGDIPEPETIGFHGDWLWEFLEGFYYRDMKIKVTLLNFDREKIAQEKNYDDYKYNIMLSCFTDLAEKYPENVVEFVDEENEKI